jgi:hypothetical protein
MNFGPETMNVFKYRPDRLDVAERDEHHVPLSPPTAQEIEDLIRADYDYRVSPTELTKIDKLALGIEDVQVATDKDVENMEGYGTQEGIRLKSESGRQKIDMTVPINDIHIGFNNAVEQWKVHAFHEVDERDARNRFLEMQGKVLFLRRAGKIRIGYMTDLSSITNPDLSSEGPRFNIFLARKCTQFAEYTNQVIFPKRGGESGKLNICLHSLGTEIYVQSKTNRSVP